MGDRLSRLDEHVRILEQQLRSTRRTLAGTALLALVAGLAAFSWTSRRERFVEIDVEQINVIEADGRRALVIANSQRLPGGVVRGREIIRHRPSTPRILFYNAEETEAGGLIYRSEERPDGYSAFGSFTFDQYNQDQVVQLLYRDDGGRRSAGLNVVDRPAGVHIGDQVERTLALQRATGAARDSIQREVDAAAARGEFGAQRLFVGSRDRTVSVRLNDTRGRERVRIFVDSMDVARMEFVDSNGTVMARYPQ